MFVVRSGTHSRMKSLSSWYSMWPSSGTGSVSRIFSVSKLLSTQTREQHISLSATLLIDRWAGLPTGQRERVRAEGRVGGEAGGGVSQQVWEGRGDGGERRLPPPLQHLWILVLTETDTWILTYILYEKAGRFVGVSKGLKQICTKEIGDVAIHCEI